MIEVKNITKSFEGRTVLNDISAVFETGKTNLIIGRSGSGKTVLIKNIIGLYPSEISGGMMKRAAIARAIALNPKYLFCDEPNSGLDPKTSLLIDDLIHDITTEYKMTTVINTHDMNSVMNIGENIIFIKEGVKEWQGTKDQVITSNNKALNDFIFASDLFRKVKEVEMHQDDGI